jgi:hypothetical protein
VDSLRLRLATLSLITLTAVSCGRNPGNPQAPSTGVAHSGHHSKVEEKLDEAEATRVLTKEHFDQIRDGITLQEVAKTLDVKPVTKTLYDGGAWVAWKGGGKVILVTFQKGKVTAKHQEGIE